MLFVEDVSDRVAGDRRHLQYLFRLLSGQKAVADERVHRGKRSALRRSRGEPARRDARALLRLWGIFTVATYLTLRHRASIGVGRDADAPESHRYASRAG